MKWFRFYHEAYRNPKVQDMRPELFKFWVNFLCLASESEVRGTVPSEGHVRRALGLGKGTVERYCRELVNLDLLIRRNTGALTPHDWDKLQPEGDDAARRKRRQRQTTCDDRPEEMSRDMSRDKNVTSCDSRAGAFLEREREREEENTPLSPPDGGKRRRRESAPFVLPEAIPADVWDAFVAMRQKIRKAPTDEAKRLVLKELARLKAEDARNEPVAVLQQSIRNSWQDVYPLKDGFGRNGHVDRRPDRPIPIHRKGDPL